MNPDQEPESPEESEPQDNAAPLDQLSNISVVGQPGTGKTTFCGKLYMKTGTVFINTQHEEAAKYFPGIPVVFDGRSALAAAMGGQKTVWNAEPWEIRKWLLDLYLTQRKAKELIPITVYVDEAHLVAPRGSFRFPDSGEFTIENIIGVVCTTHRRWNLRFIWITQRPQLMDPSVYNTCRYHIFFTLDDRDIAYFRDLRIEVENPPWYDYVIHRSG